MTTARNDPAKDASIVKFVGELRKLVDSAGFALADHWADDPFAIGIASRSDPRRLVYVSTFQKEPLRYYVELEFPPEEKSDLPFKKGTHAEDVGFDTAVEVIVRHLHAARVTKK